MKEGRVTVGIYRNLKLKSILESENYSLFVSINATSSRLEKSAGGIFGNFELNDFGVKATIAKVIKAENFIDQLALKVIYQKQ